jgi:copper(I)-binding protein
MKRLIVLMFCLLAVGLTAAQCAPATPVRVETTSTESEAIIAAPAGPQIVVSAPVVQLSTPNSAVYFELSNTGDTADALTSVETELAEAAELHETTIDANDVATMMPLDRIELPAGGSARLEPGGKHLMLVGLDSELEPGDRVPLTLHFENAAPQTIEAEVQARPGMAMSGNHEGAEGDTGHEHDQAAAPADDHAAVAAPAGQRFQAAIATYLLDTAGLHALDERLNNDGLIDPGDAGVIERVRGVLAATPWPTELAESANTLITVFDDFAAALAEDDVETAAPLAAQAHEVQHDFSHAVAQWVESHGADHQAAVDEQTRRFQAAVATYLLDTAGLHAMDERLNNDGLIDPGDAGTVQRVGGVLTATSWPTELADAAADLTTVLDQYATALSNDDAEAAAPLAAQAHEVQHDFSHAVDAWLRGEYGHD